jgi:hypothetical protein
MADRRGSLLDRLYKGSLIVAIVVLLGLVSFVQKQLNLSRESLGLTRVTPLNNAPPVLAFTTVALGGFRGLIANVLWLRVNDLQEQDKFFEMVQLSDWITKLQPHIVTVWVHLAWNMAYNISVKFTDPADRWQWVKRGIELLRDEGLKYNPNEVLIYRELAWFFQHKMGADLDDAHKFYKRAWVQEMNQVLGRGPVNFQELLHPQTPEAKERVQLLRDKFKMDPEWMKQVDDLYGPLEWHLPESHAIYWAYAALEKTDKTKLKKDDLVQCRRVIFQSLQLSFRRGRLIYPYPNSDEFIYAPNLTVVPQADRAYREIMEQEPGMRDNIANAHKNFLKWAVYYLYLYGMKTQANHWWTVMHENYPNATPPGQDLYDYVLERSKKTVVETGHDDKKAMLEGFIKTGFSYLLIDEDDAAENYFKFAEQLRAQFQVAIGPKSTQRIAMVELKDIKQEVMDRILASDPAIAARLRSKLGLAAPAVTNETSSVELQSQAPASATNAAPVGASSTPK